MLQLLSVHYPEAQLAIALLRLQVVPQPPQLASVDVLVSQPLDAMQSQFWNPGLQLPSVHMPVGEQLALAFVKLHAEPHMPQSVSVRSDVSQPLLAVMSQLP